MICVPCPESQPTTALQLAGGSFTATSRWQEASLHHGQPALRLALFIFPQLYQSPVNSSVVVCECQEREWDQGRDVECQWMGGCQCDSVRGRDRSNMGSINTRVRTGGRRDGRTLTAVYGPRLSVHRLSSGLGGLGTAWVRCASLTVHIPRKQRENLEYMRRAETSFRTTEGVFLSPRWGDGQHALAVCSALKAAKARMC
jgi:hypothetical protein